MPDDQKDTNSIEQEVEQSADNAEEKQAEDTKEQKEKTAENQSNDDKESEGTEDKEENKSAPKSKKVASAKKPEPKQKKEKSTKREEKAKTRIRVKIRAYDNKVIDKSTKTIIDTARRSGAEVVGPMPLPTNIKKFTVLRSTFVHKDSRDQYEIRTHKRLIDIYEPTEKTMEDLANLSLPAGVDIEIKM